MPSEVKIYRVEGVMKLRSGEIRKFRVEVRALSPEHALDKVYSDLGSRHKLTRRHIKIQSIKEISEDEVTSEYVRGLLALDRIVVIE